MTGATATPPSGAATTRGGNGGTRRRIRLARELGLLVAIATLVMATWLYNPLFLAEQSVRDILLGATLLTILAVGQATVIVTRNVDLSVGSVMGLSAFAASTLLMAFPDTPIVVAIGAGVAVGVLCGVVNGALVAVARVPALVVTLGTLYVFRGVDYWWASGSRVDAADMPEAFLGIGQQNLLGIPAPALIALAVVLVAGHYLRSYRSGRELYAIGSQPAAARLSGIPVDRRVFGAFVLNGALAGLAGVLYAARFGSVDATVGTGMELQVVAASVVGGVAIFGGSGTVYGAALGAVLLSTIDAALPVLQINQFWQQAVVGLLILLAIGLDRLLAVRAARRLREGRQHDG